MFRNRLAILALAALAPGAPAQKPQPLGSVSGYVFCADTNTPARLASVVLRPIPPSKGNRSTSGSSGVEARVVHTSIDGSFTIPQVAPGTYFVLALMDGYISPLAKMGLSDSDLLNPSDELRKDLLQHVPTVVVEGSGGASVNVSLERGAAVAGTVLFDDGSPAPGVSVNVLTRKQGKWIPIEPDSGDGFGHMSGTNDRGEYRISGIPPEAECLVKVEMTSSSSTNYFSKNGFASNSNTQYTISVYSGGTLRPASAKPFALKRGEERPGEDIVLPLSKLHKVQGVVTAQHDGHILNQATLSLVFADDKSPAGTTNIGMGETAFSFPFVPEGDYLLRVSNAADVRIDEVSNGPGSMPPTRTEAHTLHSYGPAEIPLHVDGDRLDVNVAVPDPAAHPN